MSKRTRIILPLLSILALLTAINVRASGPITIYAVITKVVIEPNEIAPQRIQIWGAFSLEDRARRTVLPPQTGYLYYSIPPGKEAIARKEWADLQSAVNTGQGVGFGAPNAPTGSVRHDGVERSSPDVYPIGNGVTKFTNPQTEPARIKKLREALKSRT